MDSTAKSDPLLQRFAPSASEVPEAAELEKVWGRGRGVWSWLASTDHKEIGLRYIITAFIFFLLGGILALLMRTQLARPENTLLNPDQYNQFFSVHGTTMMFLFALPILVAF